MSSRSRAALRLPVLRFPRGSSFRGRMKISVGRGFLLRRFLPRTFLTFLPRTETSWLCAYIFFLLFADREARVSSVLPQCEPPPRERERAGTNFIGNLHERGVALNEQSPARIAFSRLFLLKRERERGELVCSSFCPRGMGRIRDSREKRVAGAERELRKGILRVSSRWTRDVIFFILRTLRGGDCVDL